MVVPRATNMRRDERGFGRAAWRIKARRQIEVEVQSSFSRALSA